MLHQVVREHLEPFLRAAAEAGEGVGLPQFVEREFREFLECGVLKHGFARVRCDGCAYERLVPFSCKGRGFCPSCGGRRMTERAAHLVEGMRSRGPRQAREGFDLHANVWVSGNDRVGLERLCRYVLRPPLAQERLRRRGDGRVVVELKTAWHDGTTELVFEPVEFLERLAVITPRPEEPHRSRR